MTVIVGGLTFDTEEDGREYWRQVRAWELGAQRKARRLPKCVWCGQPMWLAQEKWGARAHRVCMEKTRNDHG